MDQRVVVDVQSVIYAELKVLAGPHDWEVGGYVFSTVLVRCPGDVAGIVSVIHTRSGWRIARVEVRAPKTRPHEAMTAVSQMLDRLIAAKGSDYVAQRIYDAPPLPEM